MSITKQVQSRSGRLGLTPQLSQIMKRTSLKVVGGAVKEVKGVVDIVTVLCY